MRSVEVSAGAGEGGNAKGGRLLVRMERVRMERVRQQQPQQHRFQSAGMADEALACVLKHIQAAQDRAAVSLVCKQWRRVDGTTRKFVIIANIYSAEPAALTRRFKRLERIKLKGKPRAAEYDLLLRDWGGYAEPWLRELGQAYDGLQTLQLRRVQVLDSDLALIAFATFGSVLQVLHLHKCAGFTTKGLLPIASSCRSLKVLSLEDSEVTDNSGEWMHALAQYNSVLEVLNFAVLGLEAIDISDLTILVQKCKSLVSLKVGESDMEELIGVLSKVPNLKELGAGSCNELRDDEEGAVPISLPAHLTALTGLWAMNDSGWRMVLPVAANLRKLELKFTLLSRNAHCELLSHCHVLEELQVRSVLGDQGMEVLAKNCKSLRRLRVDHDEAGFISQKGVVALAQGCGQLRQLILWVSDITNAALAMVGQGCLQLTDMRLVLEPVLEDVADLPLDDGIKLLLKGCLNMTRLAIYLRHGGLTDRGLGYIGEYGHKLKWVLLGCTGESDIGLANLAYKAQRLERLEIRDCPFGEAGLTTAVVAMTALKYLWVEGYRATESGGHLLALSRPHLNIEISQASPGHPGQLLAYYSLTGPRTDGPPELKVLVSNPDDRYQDIVPYIYTHVPPSY